MRVLSSVCVFISLLVGCGQQSPESPGPGIAIDGDDIAGVVTSSAGVEAGVWVIAETVDLDTRFARIVVTDDEGRYLARTLHEYARALA